MITVQKGAERGQADFGWLHAQYSFSFANYYDPNHMGFRSLRVLNEDRIDGGAGFPLHPHRDMEILTYVITGGLAHEDSMGNGAVIEAGEFQLMSAGAGIYHTEANASKTDEVHMLQIWLQPNQRGVTPDYGQRRFDDRHNRLCKVAGPAGDGASFKVHQDASVYTALLDAKSSLEHDLLAGRHGWLQLISGRVQLNGVNLEAGDSAAISNEEALSMVAEQDADFLLFDLA